METKTKYTIELLVIMVLGAFMVCSVIHTINVF